MRVESHTDVPLGMRVRLIAGDVIVGQDRGAEGSVVEHYWPHKAVKNIGRPLEYKRATWGFRVKWDRADRGSGKIHDFNLCEGWLLEKVK